MKVEIDRQEFEDLVKYVKTLKAELHKCKEINKFLNEQIEKYNKEYVKKDKNESS